MRLTEEQSWVVLEKYGVAVSEACDKCGQILGAVRFTRSGEPGAWCSRRCRDGFEHKPGCCLDCGTALNGKRKGSVFCSDVCRKRRRAKVLRIIAETPVENSALMDAIFSSRYGDGLKTGKTSSAALNAK